MTSTKKLLAHAAFAAGCVFAMGVAQSAVAGDWSGYYAGANLGAVESKSHWSHIVVPSDTGANLDATFTHNKGTSIIGGVQAGYNIQYLDNVYFGPEVSLNFSNPDGKHSCFGNYGDVEAICHSNLKWNADFVARAAASVTPDILVYVRGGATVGGTEFHPDIVFLPDWADPTGSYKKKSDTRWGYVLGLGFDMMIDPNWTIGGEFDYRNFGKSRTPFTPTAPVSDYNAPFSAETNLFATSYIVRVNYLFGEQ